MQEMLVMQIPLNGKLLNNLINQMQTNDKVIHNLNTELKMLTLLQEHKENEWVRERGGGVGGVTERMTNLL